MPLPGAIKEDMLEIQNRLDQCDRLQAINDELLAALEGAEDIDWVHNAAVTTDIEALRKICLQHADWWNHTACAAIAKAKA